MLSILCHVVYATKGLSGGVIVLNGVKIGNHAVIGAGSVVISDVPDGAIAVGSPARVVKMRSDIT
jgi:acetyltransferase-like isoleucine patch superfamily enzyme